MIKLPNKSIKHWLVLAVTALMMAASIGISNNIIGIYYTPMMDSLNILRGSLAFHTTLALLVSGVIALFVTPLIDRFGWKKILFVGIVSGFIGIAGMTVSSSLWSIYLVGIIRGIGMGFTTFVPMALILNNWFDEHKGLAFSIVTSMSGVAGFIFAPLFSFFIDSFGWRVSFIIQGLLYVLLMLPTLLYPYTIKPKNSGLLPYGSTKNSEEQEKEDQDDENSKEMTLSQILRTKPSIIIFVTLLIFSISSTLILGISQHLPGYGQLLGVPLHLVGFIVSASSVGNIAFKLISGFLSDKIGAVKTTVLMIFINMSGIVVLILTSHPISLMIGTFLFAALFPIGNIELPLLSTHFFGRSEGNQIFPIINFSQSVGGAFSFALVGYAYDFTGTYLVAFGIALILQTISLVAIFTAIYWRRKQQKL